LSSKGDHTGPRGNREYAGKEKARCPDHHFILETMRDYAEEGKL